MDAEQKLRKARVELIINQPFFGALAVFLKLKKTNDTWCETAATDGNHLFYDEKFIEKLEHHHCLFLVAHEVVHCALGHIWRRGERDRDRWNTAIDYAANSLLVDAGFKPIENCLYNKQFKGLSAEAIYERIPSGLPHRTIDTHIERSDSVEETQEAASPLDESTWRLRAKSTLEMYKEEGELPSFLLREIEELSHPTIDWKTFLSTFLVRLTRDDYSWIPPNRKYIGLGITLPSLRSKILEIVVALDTSGSISDKDLASFITEVHEIVATIPSKMTVIACDADIHEVHTYESYEAPSIPVVSGSGGTDFRPVFSRIDEEAVRPSCLIYFTDGFGTFPSEEPIYPVIWVIKKSILHERIKNKLKEERKDNFYTPWGIELEL
jgi:predicted metal-dependent peptidase